MVSFVVARASRPGTVTAKMAMPQQMTPLSEISITESSTEVFCSRFNGWAGRQLQSPSRHCHPAVPDPWGSVTLTPPNALRRAQRHLRRPRPLLAPQCSYSLSRPDPTQINPEAARRVREIRYIRFPAATLPPR